MQELRLARSIWGSRLNILLESARGALLADFCEAARKIKASPTLPPTHIHFTGSHCMKFGSPGIHPMKLIHPVSLLIAIAVASIASAPAQDAPEAPAFHSVRELADLIPHKTIMQLKVPSQMEAAMTEANGLLAQNAVDKYATWKIKVVSWVPWDAPGVVPSKFRISTLEQAINVNGSVIGVRMMVYLPAEAEPMVKKLSRGSEATVTGHLNGVNFTNNKGEGLKLNVEMRRTKIEVH
jgi:hypothetical protein